jgi:hypothetical protein
VRQALVFAERGKSRALAEHLSQGSVELLGAGPKTRRLLTKLTTVEREIALAESRLQQPEGPAGVRTARANHLRDLSLTRLRTLDRLSRDDLSSAVLVGAPPPSPDEFIRSLDPCDLVLEYTQAGDHLHLFAIERGRVNVFPRIVRVEAVREQVELLRFQLSKGTLGGEHTHRFDGFIETTLRTYFTTLYDMLLAPVDDRLDGKQLRIVPHGVLHGLPFHALEREETAVIERCVVSYAPSLATMDLLSRARKDGASPPLVLGVPDDAAPLIEREVDNVRRFVEGARVFRGREATHEALRLSERRPELLHVACHGFYCEDGTWSSGLRLGDAWVSLADLYGMKGTAALVVLSGCETGRGTVYSGDEWVGLVRGFLQAGARSVVASLWETHDRSTMSFMENFYSELAAGQPVALALAVAQRRARQSHSQPLHWAPFVVVGEPNLRLRLRRAA